MTFFAIDVSFQSVVHVLLVEPSPFQLHWYRTYIILAALSGVFFELQIIESLIPLFDAQAEAVVST